MMDRTDRHYRYFMRQITRHTLLYTEMVTAQAITYGDRDHLLGFTPDECPLILQVGGDDPKNLGDCARIAADFGYDGINLNVGCPSDRVQSGNFGACLMAQPGLVADCVAAMMVASPLPVSVKHRIGVDDIDRYQDMAHFVDCGLPNRMPPLHRPCPQSLAAGVESQRQPQHSAAAVRGCASAQSGIPSPVD